MSVLDQDLLRSAESGPKRIGKLWLIKYLKGGKLTQQQAIQAKCYDCSGMGEEAECTLEACALYPYTAFQSKSPIRVARMTAGEKKAKLEGTIKEDKCPQELEPSLQ